MTETFKEKKTLCEIAENTRNTNSLTALLQLSQKNCLILNTNRLEMLNLCVVIVEYLTVCLFELNDKKKEEYFRIFILKNELQQWLQGFEEI